MKESVAIAKEANSKKESSPTRSDNSIQSLLRNEPERQLGSLRAVVGNIRRDGDTPSAESIATHMSRMHTAQRASVLLALQRTHGNRYVQRVVMGIQAKLKVGQPGDIYEQEADRVAEQVMRMPEPRVQRQLEEEELQAKELPGETPEVTPNLEARINAIRGGGQPLSESDRAFFEPRFGYDFSQVRVHTDVKADTLNRVLKARAFTTGLDIFFRQGVYNTSSSSGRGLLAHELTHVVQQNGDKVQGKLFIGQSDDRYERQGDQVARVVLQQEQQTMHVKTRVPPQIEKEEEELTQAKIEYLQAQRKVNGEAKATAVLSHNGHLKMQWRAFINRIKLVQSGLLSPGIVSFGRNSFIIQRSPDEEWEGCSIRYTSPRPFPDILLRQFRGKDVDGDLSEPFRLIIGEGPQFILASRPAEWSLWGANRGVFGEVYTPFTEGDTLEGDDLRNPGRTRIDFSVTVWELLRGGRPARTIGDSSNWFMVYQNRWQTSPERTVRSAIKVNESGIRDLPNFGAGEGTIGRTLSHGWSISETESESFSTARSTSHSFRLTGGLEGNIRGVGGSIGTEYGFETSEQETLTNVFTSGFTFNRGTTESFSYKVPPQTFAILIPILRTRTLDLPILNTNDNGEVTGTTSLKMLITQVVGRVVNTWQLPNESALPSVREQAEEFKARVIASPQDYTIA